MVEIKAAQVQRFLAQPDANARMLLLAGRDRGRVKESVQSHSDALARGECGPIGGAGFSR